MRQRVQQIAKERRGKFDAAEPLRIPRLVLILTEHERVQRRIRTGLEKVYEELKTEKRRKKK
jgi:hypothetical protein